jgi:hypothetical protein
LNVGAMINVGAEEDPFVKPEIYIESKPVIGSTVHLYLVYRDELGNEWITRSDSGGSNFGGPMDFQVNVPIELSLDARGNISPADRNSTLLDLGGYTADEAWARIVKYGWDFQENGYIYNLFGTNSNAYIGAQLEAIGLNPLDNLPTSITLAEAIGFDFYVDMVADRTPPSDGIFRGTTGADTHLGIQVDEVIWGLDGNDTIFGGDGDDVIGGGAGSDTASYSGDQTSYTLQLSRAGTTITDRRPSQDGTDSLIDVENLQFADEAFDIGIRLGAVELSSQDFAAITELYIAYFDRAPAAKGLLYWATRLEDGMTLSEIAESFFVQPETQRTYETFLDDDGNVANTEAFVTAVFNNLLGRDPSGPYWINELDRPNTEITPAIFILAVLNGAKAVTGGAADAAYLDAKTDIGVYFSAIKGLSDYDDTVSVLNLYDGSAVSVTNAVTEIDRIYVEALDPNTGEFLMPLLGVIDDPFAVA